MSHNQANVSPLELARAFCDQIAVDLTLAQFSTVIDRNASETDPNVCHSHDFCDANQTMLDAMDELSIDYDQDRHELINAAWQIAKDADFSADDCEDIADDDTRSNGPRR